MIHYIQPYRFDKNIGLSINQAIEQLNAPANDWICLLDHDVLWLRPDGKKQLEEILHTTRIDILGPSTNRLAAEHQLVSRAENQDVFSNTDIAFHIRIANHLHETNYGKLFAVTSTLAAFCLCFRISTWQKLGGFLENSIQFDTIFCERARKSGLRLAIMTGIYVFHLYRMWSESPKQAVQHLLPESPDHQTHV